MPRNSSGVYSLPAGNPVITNTTISSVWANTTLDDIATALTDSLSRTGDGGMLDQFLAVAGTVGAPGISFSLDPTAGLYRNASNDLRMAINGGDVMQWETNRVTVRGTAPALEMRETDATANNGRWDVVATGEDLFVRVLTDAGVATNFISVSRTAGVVDAIVLAGTVIGLTGLAQASNGAAAGPAYSFASDPDIGMYRAGANQLGFATNGVERVIFGNVNASFAVNVVAPVGTAADPSYTFTGDTDTGFSSATANTIVASTAGVARVTIASSGVTFVPSIFIPDGVVGAPGIAFTSNPDTGIFLSATALIRFTCDGTEIFRVGPTAINTFNAPLRLQDGSTGTPALSFNNDNNTGFWWDSGATDEIQMSLGGTSYLIGFRNIPQNIQNGNYTLLLTDAGKHIYKASGGAGETITIPANSSVAFPIGTAVTFINKGGGNLSIAITTDTMTLMGAGTTGTRTLATNGIATAVKVTATSWVISGTNLT